MAIQRVPWQAFSTPVPTWAFLAREVSTEWEDFTNYIAVEKYAGAQAEVLKLARGHDPYLLSLESYEDCVANLNAHPVLSLFAMDTRVKNGKTKNRAVLGAKSSATMECSQKAFRVVLPRATDIGRDTLLACVGSIAPVRRQHRRRVEICR